METKTYIELSDILGVRFTCRCGVTFETNLGEKNIEVPFLRAYQCTQCNDSWTFGMTGEQVTNRQLTPLLNFLNSIKMLKEALAKTPSEFSLTFEIKPVPEGRS